MENGHYGTSRMNGEIPSVPITTLAGISSLTDLLTELPIPGPSSSGGGTVHSSGSEILYSPLIAEQALQLLTNPSEALVNTLNATLSNTSTDYLELKSPPSSSAINSANNIKASNPLQEALLSKNPTLFGGTLRSSSSSAVAVATTNQGGLNNGRGSAVEVLPPQNTAPPAPPPIQETKTTTPQEEVSDAKSSSSTETAALAVKPEKKEVPRQIIPVKTVDKKEEEKGQSGVKPEEKTQPLPPPPVQKPPDEAKEEPALPKEEKIEEPKIKPPLVVNNNNKINESSKRHAVPSSSEISAALSTKKQPLVLLNKLSKEDEALMQKSLKEYKKTSPTKRVRRKSVSDGEEEDEEEDSSTSGRRKNKFFRATEKNREDEKRRVREERKRNRRRKVEEDEEDYVASEEEEDVSQKKKAKVSPEGEGGSKEAAEADEVDPDGFCISKFIPQKKTRTFQKRQASPSAKIDSEELMESNLFISFNKTVELIFDNMEEVNLNDLDASQDDLELPPEILIQKYQLQDLASETARLKNLGAMDSVPTDRLVKLLTILEINIRDGARVCPIPSEDEEEDILWQELANERVNRAADASLTVLHILTSKNMNKCVYIDDVIDRLAIFLRFQLSNTIYPCYDPVYKEISRKNYTYMGSMKRIRSNAHAVRDKNILGLYNKVLELLTMLSELVKKQLLTDTTVLHISSLAVAPFFVEGIPQLQLGALKLVTNLFSKYEKHRKLMLDDILSSIVRLPSSKRNLRSYRLNSSNHIQMLTALVLQLIQCVVVLPNNIATSSKDNSSSSTKTTPSKSVKGHPGTENASEEVVSSMDRDVLIENRYEMAMATAHQFLTVFLMKCGSKNEEIDYRPIFENFVQDLLTTVNTPEWPAAELLLSFLGHVLREKFKNRSTELSLRLSSLDYLGVVAARLRRDAVQSKLKVDVIDSIIKLIKKEEEKEDGYDGENSLASSIQEDLADDPEELRVTFLRRVLLDYLAVQGGEDDQAIMNARAFYICQWYRDVNAEGRRPSPVKKTKAKKKKKRSSRRSSSESSSEEEELSEEEEEAPPEEDSSLKKAEAYAHKEKRKDFLAEKILPFGSSRGKKRRVVLSTHIDPPSAHLIVKYLSSKRPFFNSFDSYLQDIIHVLFEQSTQVRTRALKCMALIVQEDPNVLLRADMQKWVHFSFTDLSTMVREAAVDLVGKFILHRRDLIEQYYPMVSSRILDTGVSVRKRVIKILKDICLQFPDYEMIPDICGKMIRRINDEEGIRKLVMEVFQNMWFQPVRERNRSPEEEKLLITRAKNITDVVVACRHTGLEWFEQLLQTLFKPPEDKEDSTKKVVEPPKHLVLACQQIVDCIIESVFQMEESGNVEDPSSNANAGASTNGPSGSSSNRIVACLHTLYLFAKIRPVLLVEHVQTLQPYLSITCKTKNDILTIVHVARTMELVVPLIKHPSEVFLSQLEENSVKLVLEHNNPACVSCLGSIVNNVTKNYGLIRDCFLKYCNKITIYRKAHEANPLDPRLKKSMQVFLRGLYTVGLFLRHFDFSNPDIYKGLPGGKDTVDEIFETMFYFMRHDSTDIQTTTLQALGNLCVRHFNFMLTTKLKNLYIDILKEDFYDTKHKVVVVNNLENYLCEEENRMIRQDKDWLENSKKENLKEMRDVTSGMASTVIQVYLKVILNSVVHPALEVRRAALRVIGLVLAQGLVNPVQIVPYLICMSTDPAPAVSHTSDRELQEIGRKYPTFIYTKLFQGIKLSHRLQVTIRKDGEVVRGFREKEDGELPTALHGFMYSIMKTTKSQRRALLNNLLKQFDDYTNEISLAQRLYLADNLAYIPYTVVDEPLFVMHHIQIMVSVMGSNMLQLFKESLKPPPNCEAKLNQETGKYEYLYDEDLDDDFNSVISRLPDDPRVSLDCIRSSQGCMLLLVLKDHLKDFYGLTESRISQYSPTDTSKVNERQVNRRSNVRFNPKATIEIIAKGDLNRELTEDDKKEIVSKYLQFKELMNRIDHDDEEDEEFRNNSSSCSLANRSSSLHSLNTTPTSSPQKSSRREGGEDHEFLPPSAPPASSSSERHSRTNNTTTSSSSSSSSHHRSSRNAHTEQLNNHSAEGQTTVVGSSDNNDSRVAHVPKLTINIGQRTSSTTAPSSSSSSSRDRHHRSSRSHRHHSSSSSSSHHHHRSSSSSSSSHKHHKKKKKRKKYSDEDSSDSDYS